MLSAVARLFSFQAPETSNEATASRNERRTATSRRTRDQATSTEYRLTQVAQASTSSGPSEASRVPNEQEYPIGDPLNMLSNLLKMYPETGKLYNHS